jgi:Tol biopolymer transport system component
MTDLATPLSTALADRYRIERELGAGGMATVYLAHDLRHERKVAIKVLRPELAAVIGAERFVREIRTIAALQHPHILGLIDSGEVEGTAYYVMPFVEGESLRDRLVREKQLPIADAVRTATEVASALDYAHRHGVIHRDIKPENILLHDGTALVADFGIALAVTVAGGTRMTETGMSLGTPHYMSPEQAMGEREITARSDVYALGCVTYEMLIGEPPFTGPTAQAVVAKVLTEEPRPLTLHRKTIPPHVEAAVLTALAKLPADRFESAAAFARALGDPSFSTSFSAQLPHTSGAKRRVGAGLLIGVALAALVLGASAAWFTRPQPARPTPAFHFYITGDTARALTYDFAVSPDGGTVVYRARTVTGNQLFLQRFSELEPKPIPGTADASQGIFFSPDGSWLAFVTDQAIKKIRLDGSGLGTVASFDGLYTGGTWGPDDSIVFTKYDGRLYRVSAEGGTPVMVPLPDAPKGLTLASPHFLPSGRALLSTAFSGGPQPRVAIVSLPSGGVKLLGPGLAPKYVEPGFIVFTGIDGSLVLQPFDPVRLDTTGARRRIADGVMIYFGVDARFDVSRTGTLAYGVVRRNQNSLVLFDRSGKGPALSQGPVWVPRVSPDGRRVAYGRVGDGPFADIWIYDRTLETSQRLTSGGEVGPDYNDPVWSPDGRRLALSAVNGDSKDLYLTATDAAGKPSLLLHRPGEQWPSDWTRDQKELLFTDIPLNGKRAIMALPLTEGAEPHAVVLTNYNATGGRLSPDGHWLAFDSDETGETEVYLQPFPGSGGGRVRVSSDGGRFPVWAKSGQELFYWNQDRLISAQLRLGAEVSVVRRQELFQADYQQGGVLAQYDVIPDGQHFAVATGGMSNRIPIVTDVRREAAR